MFADVALKCPHAITTTPFTLQAIRIVQFGCVVHGCYQCRFIVCNGEGDTTIRDFSSFEHCVDNKLLLFQVGNEPVLFPYCLLPIMEEDSLYQLVYDPIQAASMCSTF